MDSCRQLQNRKKYLIVWNNCHYTSLYGKGEGELDSALLSVIALPDMLLYITISQLRVVVNTALPSLYGARGRNYE